jgi:hypothetical protein
MSWDTEDLKSFEPLPLQDRGFLGKSKAESRPKPLTSVGEATSGRPNRA